MPYTQRDKESGHKLNAYHHDEDEKLDHDNIKFTRRVMMDRKTIQQQPDVRPDDRISVKMIYNGDEHGRSTDMHDLKDFLLMSGIVLVVAWVIAF